MIICLKVRKSLLLSKLWEPQETFRNVVTLNIKADIFFNKELKKCFAIKPQFRGHNN